MNGRNPAASVRARLLNRARETRQDFNLILSQYALERLLYRLSISPHADQFLLKGALLFDLWFDVSHRPTRDADFLGLGSAELPHLETIFKDVCMMDSEDGVMFRPDTVQAAEIRKEANYAGVRVTLLGLIDCALPGPDRHRFRRCRHTRAGGGPVPRDAPGLPGAKVARLSALYRSGGKAGGNGRARYRQQPNERFFDLWILSRYTDFDGDTLRRAIRATFDRRKTELPPGVPFGLTDDFARDTRKQMQWQAFLGKNRLEALELEVLVAALRDFLLPAIAAANADTHLPHRWSAGGPWTPAAT